MKTYARIDSGIVMEIIAPLARDIDYPLPLAEGETAPWNKGDEVPIEQRFTPEIVATLVDITDVSPAPDQRWTYDGKVFVAPVQETPPAS